MSPLEVRAVLGAGSRTPKGCLGQWTPGETVPGNPLEFPIQVQVQPVFPAGTCYLVAVFPFPPFPWRACLSETVGRLQQHFERIRKIARPDLALPHIRVGRITLRGGGISVGVCEFWVSSQVSTGMRGAMEWSAPGRLGVVSSWEAGFLGDPSLYPYPLCPS
jgi:hypothetical protein